MRRLLLASSDVGRFSVLKDMLGPGRHEVAVITSASDHRPQRLRDAKLRAVRDAMGECDLNAGELDLGAWPSPELVRLLGRAAAVWFTGGNAFWLVDRVLSAPCLELTARVDAGLVFSGESAGAVIAGINLDGVGAMDDPSVAPHHDRALALVPYVIVPHDANPRYAGPGPGAAIPRLYLADGTAALFAGDELHIVEL